MELTTQLNEKQRNILVYISKFIQEKGYPPSVREMGAAVGLSSSSTVHAHLSQLEKKGYVRRDPTKPRALEILPLSHSFLLMEDDNFQVNNHLFNKKTVTVPLLGTVTAGLPILAYEDIENVFVLPSALVGNDQLFMLRVKGDSMIDAGIFDKDLVFVKKQVTAINRDIVVALINDEATIKRFYKEKDCIRLQPENKSHTPIFVKDVKILGKIVGLYRQI
jgi:repressor LexA